MAGQFSNRLVPETCMFTGTGSGTLAEKLKLSSQVHHAILSLNRSVQREISAGELRMTSGV